MISRKLLYSLSYILLLGIPAVVLSFFVKQEIDVGSVVLVTGVALLVGGVIDIWAVRQNRNDDFFIWEYNSKSILGFKLYGVPIEDYVLFLVFTPFFIIVIYEAIKKFLYFQNKFVLALFFAAIILIVWHGVWRYAIKKKK